MIVNNSFRNALVSVCSAQAQEILAAKRHLDNVVYNVRALILSDLNDHRLTTFKIKWDRGTVTVNDNEVLLCGIIGKEEFAKTLEQLPTKLKDVLGHDVLLTYHQRHEFNVKLFLSTLELEKAKRAAGMRSAFAYWNLDDPELHDDEVIDKVELEKFDVQRGERGYKKTCHINKCGEIVRDNNTGGKTDRELLETERRRLEAKRRLFATANGISEQHTVDEYGHIHLCESKSTDSSQHQYDTRSTLRDDDVNSDTRTTLKNDQPSSEDEEGVQKIILIITNDKANTRIRMVTQGATQINHKPEITD